MIITSDLALVGSSLLSNYALHVVDGAIVDAGQRDVLLARKAQSHPSTQDLPVLDLGHKLMLPGTINAHNHSFQSLLRGFGDDLPFLEWRQRALYRFTPRILAFPSNSQGDPRRTGVYIGALFAFAEMALHGVTTVCDFFYLNEGANENAKAVILAAQDLGLRIVLARCFYDWEGAPASYRETCTQARDNFTALCKEFQNQGPKRSAKVSLLPAPHSLHGASEEMIRTAVACAKEQKTRWHIHLAEEEYQVKEALARYGQRPLGAVSAMGVLDEDMVAVHGCWFDEAERTLLAERGASLAYCPGSNMFLGDGVTNVVDLRNKGVKIALGTDGGCSNSRVSVFDEMRSCALLQKVEHLSGQAITAESCFSMGTDMGAEVLGLDVGILTIGKRADLCFVDLEDPSIWPVQSLSKNLVYSLSSRAISDVFVEGKPVVRDRSLVQVPLEEVQKKVRALTCDWRVE